ncbi:YbjN domain-containing protein [Micromonospora sp. NPDC049559]|uniref:YbjN domain-containing protein n=1 Tax=Micromonospora sp. NPDC049559 TaxID=3155923 RepID=UPI0034383929
MPSPGFEDTSDSPSGEGRLRTLQPLTHDLIAATLTARGYTFYTDSDGDLVGKWDDNLIYFFRLGTDGDLLQVRTLAATEFTIDDVPALHAFCNSWNHDRLWPKAYVHVNDDGSARVCGEVVADLERGVTPEQLDQLISCGISTGCQMSDAVAELRS